MNRYHINVLHNSISALQSQYSKWL